ncbi:MAG: SDR family oxidoreductase, partial [Bacteroidota bacterium]
MKYLLTGGHSGIGLELTNVLLKEGHDIGLIVRNEKRKQDTLSQLEKPEKVDFFFADLSVPAEVQRVAQDISAKWDHIDGLFNNAGLLAGEARYSVRGNEMQLEINALAAYNLTQALMPLLSKAKKAFVVNTAT